MRLDDSCMGDFTRRFASPNIHRGQLGPQNPQNATQINGESYRLGSRSRGRELPIDDYDAMSWVVAPKQWLGRGANA